MSNTLPVENTTRALRGMAIAQLRADGYEVTRAPASQFALQQQVYLISKAGQSRTVALRTSTTGWLGFRRMETTFPALSGIDSVLHVYLSQDRSTFTLSLTAAVDVWSDLGRRVAHTLQDGKVPGSIVWVNMEEITSLSGLDWFVTPFTYLVPGGHVDEEGESDVDPIQAALGLPDWMWAAVQDRANRACVAPDVVIRVLLGDHLAAGTQASLPVSLGA